MNMISSGIKKPGFGKWFQDNVDPVDTDNKGRHATTYRHRIKIDGEAMLIDTPGMRELDNFYVICIDMLRQKK